jgi:predicted nuclease with TOPRIM domain
MKKKIMEEFHKLIDKGRELTKKHDDLFNEIIKDDRIPDNLKESLEKIHNQMTDTNQKIFNFLDEKNVEKTIKIKVESINPVGDTITGQKINFTYKPYESRVFITIGDCMYRINEIGEILDSFVPTKVK